MEKYTIKWKYKSACYVFQTLPTLFSYKQIDNGTIQMLERVELKADDKVRKNILNMCS